MSEEDKIWIMKLVKQLMGCVRESEHRINRHTSAKTKVAKRMLKYFAENIELGNMSGDGDDEKEASEIRVNGIKLKMREIYCKLIDEYDALPMRAADAVVDFFRARPGGYKSIYSFRGIAYKHYIMTKGFKPTAKSNSLNDMVKLKKIISALI